MVITVFSEYQTLCDFVKSKGLEEEYLKFREDYKERDLITIRNKDDYCTGEIGVFFDTDPSYFIEKVREFNGFHRLKEVNVSYQLGTCEGSGKHQVCNDTAYWNYYIPESEFSKLWNSNEHDAWSWGRR